MNGYQYLKRGHIMYNQVSVQGPVIESKQDLRAQLAQYVAQQPESTQAHHKWMKRLQVAGAGIMVAAFIVAMYVSVAWKSVNPLMIPIAWFLFAASAAPALIFVGLDAITLRAFPPVVVPGKQPRFVTGQGAVWTGWAFILLALVVAAFWGTFAYAVGTLDLAMIARLATIVGIIMGVGMAISITVSILYSIFRAIARSR
jgi:hypothetical protein